MATNVLSSAFPSRNAAPADDGAAAPSPLRWIFDRIVETQSRRAEREIVRQQWALKHWPTEALNTSRSSHSKAVS